jgi:hypothetical protein
MCVPPNRPAVSYASILGATIPVVGATSNRLRELTSPRHAVGPCNGLDLRTLVVPMRLAFRTNNFSPASLVLALVRDVHALLHSVTSQPLGSCFTQQKHQLRAQPACSGRRRAICR